MSDRKKYDALYYEKNKKKISEKNKERRMLVKLFTVINKHERLYEIINKVMFYEPDTFEIL